MKAKILLPVLVLFTFCCTSSLEAQYNNWDEYEQTDAVSSFDQYFQKGVEAVAASDLRSAADYFETAKSDAAGRKDKELKRKARDAQRRVNNFYAPYFENISEGRAAFQERDWKRAQLAFESAQALVDEYRGESFPEFAAVDERLAGEAGRELNQAVRQRQHLVQEQLRRAEQLFHNRAYDAVLQEIQAAESLLIEDREQAQFDRLTQLERQTRYNQHFARGEEAMQQQQFEQALQEYQAAKEHLAGPEVEQRINEINSRLHYELLKQGQDAFFAGQYEAAARRLEEAASYQDSDYLRRIRENAYKTLRERGQTALDQGDHETSTRYFQLAGRFVENSDIQSDIQQAKAFKKYEKHLEKGMADLEAGNLKRARRRLAKAAKYQQTPLLDEQMKAIDRYFARLSEGKELLKTNPSRAWQSFRQAQGQFDTPEVRQYLAEAREAAGGVVGAESGEVFFN